MPKFTYKKSLSQYLNKSLNYKRLIFINFLILFLLIFISELIFNFFFNKHHFGFYARELRNQKIPISVELEDTRYKYFYLRNDLGFQGNNIDPREIKILFQGGSAGDELFLPPQFRIVNKLNQKFLNDNYDINIVNASKGGKSTRGIIWDFYYWFDKIEDFSPKIVIFYIGLNDTGLQKDNQFDYLENKGFLKRSEDYIKNQSFFYDIFRKIKIKYFINNKTETLNYKLDSTLQKLYENYQYINYQDAKTKYHNYKLNDKDIITINNFENNLNNLNKIISEKKFTPIFITQIKFNGLNDVKLYLINEHLKYFSNKNNYKIIKLDEKITNLPKNFFYDEIHTTIKGSEFISENIYPDLKNIIEETYFLNIIKKN
jgi:lysophospholipase L1-like esterase